MRFHPFAIEYQFKNLLTDYVRQDVTNEPLDYFVRCALGHLLRQPDGGVHLPRTFCRT